MRGLNGSEAKLAQAVFTRISSGQGAASLQDARRLAGLAPDSPDAQHALALCLAQAGLVEEADRAFLRALDLAPGQRIILGNRAQFLRKSGRIEQAGECWRERVRLEPADANAWTELGLVLLESVRTGTSAAERANTAMDPNDEAITALRRAVELDPKLVRAWHGLANALRTAEALPEAEEAIRKALALDSGQPALWASLAGILRLAGRPEPAVAAYAEAVRLGLRAPDVRCAHAGALADCLRIEDARAALADVIEAHPDWGPAYAALAHLSSEYGVPVGQTDRPDGFFRRAVDARSEDVNLRLALVRFLLESKQGDEALEHVQHLRRRADHPALVALQANALDQLGRIEEAAACYAQVDPLFQGGDPAFNRAYTRHLLKSARWREAAQRAQLALTNDPQDQESLAYLATAWRLLNDPREEWLCDYRSLASLRPIETPAGWSHMEAFLADLMGALAPLHLARSQPVAQSVRGGSQTPGRLFGRPDPRISALRQVLSDAVKAWLAELPRDASHPFLARVASRVAITGSWSVKLWRAGSHANHVHQDGWMSSAFYVALPVSVRQGEAGQSGRRESLPGSLQLGQPPAELGLGLAPRRVIQPLVGHLALFPSYFWHGTTAFDDEEPRISVAFDMVPRH